ncbi:MAG: TetR/AcrR family transcriptional regulator [Pseudomonadota bacterium]
MDAAKRLAVEGGLSAITVHAVASAAGVTKGGFLHHYPSKQALIDAIFEEVLEQLASEIEHRASNDRAARGVFTRAYIDLAFGGDAPATDETWIALSLLMLDDHALRLKWTNWLSDQLALYREDPADIELNIARFAIDGAWLAQYFGVPIPERNKMHEILTKRTLSAG